jgi:hypothetical protein
MNKPDSFDLEAFIFQSLRDLTNVYRAGAGLPPLKNVPEKSIYEQMVAGNHTIGVFKDGKLIAADEQVYIPPEPKYMAESEEWLYGRDEDEPDRYQSEDERLDAPEHGQADELNKLR